MNRNDSRIPCICAVGPNPAWQKTVVLSRFAPGEINRAVSMDARASGKGVNFSRAVRTWDRSEVVLFHFTGGMTGRHLTEELTREGIRAHDADLPGETRTCTTLLCRATHSMTEVIEPSPEAPPEAVDTLSGMIRMELASCDALALLGTVPPGVKDGFYADLARTARAAGKPVLLDSWQDIGKVLEIGVDYLKINREELQKVSGKTDMAAGVRAIRADYAVGTAAITDGADSACLAGPDGVFLYEIPKLSGLRSPLGSGDTCSGVFLSECLRGTAPSEAFRLALGAASANCLSDYPADYRTEDARKLADAIRVTRVME